MNLESIHNLSAAHFASYSTRKTSSIQSQWVEISDIILNHVIKIALKSLLGNPDGFKYRWNRKTPAEKKKHVTCAKSAWHKDPIYFFLSHTVDDKQVHIWIIAAGVKFWWMVNLAPNDSDNWVEGKCYRWDFSVVKPQQQDECTRKIVYRE